MEKKLDPSITREQISVLIVNSRETGVSQFVRFYPFSDLLLLCRERAGSFNDRNVNKLVYFNPRSVYTYNAAKESLKKRDTHWSMIITYNLKVYEIQFFWQLKLNVDFTTLLRFFMAP